ncbi:TonB-dependent receptor [Pseudomonas putida]|uniref:TonB-dependent receptor n=2 Tax=Pseudomonas TaxID=286 RepID=A0A7W2L266_PSEPU|nr:MULTISPECIES: TonB-dependent receptor [Pseudomonas]MBA6117080.1 TonB-dependent receptor [Pseudomonas putida]MBI6943801.1 TonB-dependent receptor [Pseudomonas putida]MBI6959886.1 TonB-dependent receptor [Pseudomonas putida]MCZ9638495.1 TonB-dependent receptor [Pseudomonas putida]MEC4878683.1 TonB-dependent receptor [Pseudomonas sp. NC26]
MSYSVDRGILLCSLLTALSVVSSHTLAADAKDHDEQPDRAKKAAQSAGALETVTVTAQRRSEDLQKVPITVQSFDAERLQNAGVSSTVDLGRLTPGLVYGRGVGLGSPFLRGVGTSSNGPGVENSVAVYVDGVYQATKSSAISDITDVERVEVLKGPQGTLFGRNASGGLIHIMTKDPTYEPEGRIKVGYANYDTRTTSGYGSLGLSENVAANLSFSVSDQGKGWGKNEFNGKDVNATDKGNVRSKLLWDINDSTSLLLSADYAKFDSSVGLSIRPFKGLKPRWGSVYTGGDYDINSDAQPSLKSNAGGVSAKLQHYFDSAVLTSTTAWRDSNYEFVAEGDVTPTPFLETNIKVNEKQFSQEFQLSGGDATSLQWTTGVYYFNYKGDQLSVRSGLNFPTLRSSVTHGWQDAESFAVYGQATQALSSRDRLTFGTRYTWEWRDLSGYNQSNFPDGRAIRSRVPGQEETFKEPSWRVAYEHDFSDDVLGYISYNRGFKSGTFNVLSLTAAAVEPEIVDAYETGLKTQWADNKVRLNASMFYYDFKDIQLSSFTPSGQTLRNAAAADIYGVDVDLEVAPTPQLRLTLSGEWLHARYTSFPDAPGARPLPGGGNAVTPTDASGNDMVRAPRWSANAGVHYSIPVALGVVDLSANYSYTAKVYHEADNYLYQPSLGLVGADISWSPDDKFKVSLWGQNLTNELYYNLISANPSASLAAVGEPRTFGVSVEQKF